MWRGSGQDDEPFSWDAFLFDRQTGTTFLVSRAVSSASLTAGFSIQEPLALSADGRQVVFVSGSTALVAGMQPAPSPRTTFSSTTAPWERCGC